MTLRALALGLSLAASFAGCAMQHGRDDDAGSSGSDAGTPGSDAGSPGADAAPICPPVACADGCRTITGPDGCITCRCEPASCASDADCSIARDVGVCCEFCGGAYTAAEVAADPCLVRNGDPVPGACPVPDCRDVLCADVDCAFSPRSVCEAGVCIHAFDCAADQVMFQGECAPRCATHADCVIARDVQACCGPMCGAYPRDLALDRPCWHAEGEPSGGCPVPLDLCDGLGCAVMPCPEQATAVCMDDGTCAMVDTPSTCPAGTHESSGRCVH